MSALTPEKLAELRTLADFLESVGSYSDMRDWLPALLAAAAERDALSAAIARVRELHRESHGSMSALYPNLICKCGKDYPCPTIRALDATPETGGES